MNEFNNRIAAQRKILQIVNRRILAKEELFGLSSKAIERWVMINQLESESRLVCLIRSASEKLFFLANKSQEQITDDYKTISSEISAISKEINMEIG